MKNYLHALCGEIWAIQPEKLALLLNGNTVALDVDARETTSSRNIGGGIAVVPVYGVITQHSDIWTELFGGATTESIGRMIDAAVADNSVGTIILDVHSPGGSVYGVQELSDKIYNARGTKPIVAQVNSYAASAALWIASAADRIAITPSGEIGSIGVIAVHQEVSKAEENFGIKTTIIKAGKFKAEANEHEPLSDEARDNLQKRVDEYYTDFVKAVARNRSVTPSVVERDFGQGRMMGAKEAVGVGLADEVKTFEQTVQGIFKKQAKRRSAAAQVDMAKLR